MMRDDKQKYQLLKPVSGLLPDLMMYRLERFIYLLLISMTIGFFIFIPIHKIGISVCLFSRIFNTSCFFCGMMRSLHFTATGHIYKAFLFHPFGPVLFFVLILLIPFLIFDSLFIKLLGFSERKSAKKKYIYMSGVSVFIIYGLLRMFVTI